jgi:azurin
MLGYRVGIAQTAVSRPIDLKIKSDGDFLAFTPEELTCPTRAHVRLWFHHAGQRIMQEHNWVLVKPGSAEAVEQAAAQAGEANRWLPRGNPNILAATPMCGLGQTEMIEFVAPAPGDYPFICSFPGHAAEMRGVLHVTR